MDDILIMQFLKKKGIISERDIHEFHELADVSLSEYPVYLNSDTESSYSQEHAKALVSKMYHFENGRKYIGEKYSINTAKDVCHKYKDKLKAEITVCDVYVAINSHYHNCINLYRQWFNDNIDCKIIESAINFWFMDEDCLWENKIHKYYFE